MTYTHNDSDNTLTSLYKTMQYGPSDLPEIRVAARLTTGSSPDIGGGGNINTGVDAFGRLRVSSPYTLFDSQNRYAVNSKFSFDAVSGGSTLLLQNESTVELSVSDVSGSRVYAESKRVFPYQPGKSLLIYTTFVFAEPKENLRQRVGYFGTQNGIFLEQVGSDVHICKRSFTTGAAVDTAIAQENWNVDKMDGSGPSGIELDLTKAQIFFIDIEWLGVGSVRTGFVINGNYYITHIFNHANHVTSVYMSTACLPVRYEIENTSATTGSSNMKMICSSVISEGGFNPTGAIFSASTGTTAKRLSTAGVFYPVVSIRLNSNRLDAVVQPVQADILSPSVNYYRWEVRFNPTLTGANWQAHENGTVDYDVTATAVTGGITVASGYASSRELTNLGDGDNFALQIGRSLAGVSDVITLCLAATSANADVLAGIGWKETVPSFQ